MTYDELIAAGFSPEEANAILGAPGSSDNPGGSGDYSDYMPQPSGQFVTLPNGHYALVNPKTGAIVADYGARPTAGSGNALGYAQLANTQANQAAAQAAQQAALAEQIRQYNETMGYNKAVYNTDTSGHDALGNPTLAAQLGLGNLDVSRGNLGVNQGNLALSQQKQAWDQYTKLADLASNPRNFVQTFFMNRGFQPPADVARYGNTPSNASQIMPFQQWQQSMGYGQAAPMSGVMNGGMEQMPSMGGGGPVPIPYFLGGSTGTPKAPGQFQPPTNAPVGGFGGQNNPNNPYAGTNINYGGSPTTADTAMINGVKTWAGGPYSGKPVDQSPANAGDLTPYLKAGQAAGQARMMARGGNITMYVPHALVNLATGRTVAIAGERGKETAHFNGAALIDQNAGSSSYDANPTQDPSWPFGDPGGQMPSPGVYTSAPTTSTSTSTAPTYAGPTNDPFTQAPQIQGAPVQQLPNTSTTGANASFNLSPEQLAYIQSQTAGIAQANAAQPKTTPTMTTTTTPLSLAFQTSPPPPSDVAPAPTLTDTFTPGTQGGPVSYGESVPSQMPSYLSGEDFQAASPVTEAVRRLPFMQRLWGQGRGDQAYGTDRPQRTDLPPDLPLLSRLAWNQLSPTERDTLMSFASSLGITPDDYMNLIDQYSPSGGISYQRPFGNSIRYNEQ